MDRLHRRWWLFVLKNAALHDFVDDGTESIILRLAVRHDLGDDRPIRELNAGACSIDKQLGGEAADDLFLVAREQSLEFIHVVKARAVFERVTRIYCGSKRHAHPLWKIALGLDVIRALALGRHDAIAIAPR